MSFTTTIYDDVMMECKDRLFRYETYVPYFTASFTCHRFHIRNVKKPVYWQGARIPNLRLHTVICAPPGFMKTHYLETLAVDDYAVFNNSGTSMVRKESVTEASLIGTYTNGGQLRKGIAEEHKEALVVIDEFTGILNALKSQFNNQLESQLLTLLDSGNINKDIAGGDPISYTSHMTLWTGIQPTRFDMSAGLGRRLSMLLYIPSSYDNAQLRKIVHNSRNQEPNQTELKQLYKQIRDFKDEMYMISKLTFSDEILEFYEKNNFYMFEMQFFDKLILGYNLAKYGCERHVDLKLDKELCEMIKRMKTWRQQIHGGVESIMLEKIIAEHGNTVNFSDLVKACGMYNWSIGQVTTTVRAMCESGILRRDRKSVTLVK